MSGVIITLRASIPAHSVEGDKGQTYCLETVRVQKSHSGKSAQLPTMYGPPLDCKEIVGRSTVCANVFGLLVGDFSPGHDDDPRVPILITPTVND